MDLIRRALKQLLALSYHVPDQALNVPLNRCPTLPRSRFMMQVR